MEYQQEIFNALYQQWELQVSDVVSEEEIKRQLAIRILMMMDKDPERFFQLMYRLDVPEHKLRMIWADADAPDKIAAMVYERQLQKIQSRSRNKFNTPEDPELQW
ncbi:MAG: hypothetical protein EOP56_16500 [Sphingobacteriales bacterium]|nr:MAG: hypothetical protein EOP56_16500 [Sphingobacteriales bacterium]